MTDRVQFREDEETLAYLARRGINPNELARDLLEGEVKRMRAAEKWARIRRRGIKLDRPAAELVREDRDRDHGGEIP